MDFNLTNQKTLQTVKASEIDELCTWLRELLAELKGYFTTEEKESWIPAFRKQYEFTCQKARELATVQCRSQRVMERRKNMLERCQKELGVYLADYRAMLSHQEYCQEMSSDRANGI